MTRQARVLAVVNRKGGVGKTTTAVNLAHGLSRKLLRRVQPKDLQRVRDTSRLFQYRKRFYYIGGHVLLVDFDPQGHCARALGIRSNGADVGEVLVGRQNLSQAVISADRSAEGFPRPNLWLLPASDNLEQAKEALRSQSTEYVLAGMESKEQWLLALMSRRFGLACERFSFIIFDCAPGLDLFARIICQFAGMAIVPVKPDFLSMAVPVQNRHETGDIIQLGRRVRLHTIVPTFTVERQRLDQEMLEELRQIHGELVGDPIPRSQLVAEAPGYQQTVFEMDSGYDNPATVAYQRLVDRVYYG